MTRLRLALALAGLTSTFAQSQTFDRATYTYDRLTQTWNQSVPALGSDQKPYAFFLKVTVDANTATVPEPFCDSDDPFEASLCEASRPANTITATSEVTGPRNLGVFPLFTTEAASIYPRLVNLQRYYNKHEEYEVYHTDRLTTTRMQELDNRKNKALAELFLIHLRLYYAEANISTKCMRIKRAQGYLNQVAGEPQQVFSQLPDLHTREALTRLSAQVYQEVRNPSACRLISVKNQAAERDDMTSLTLTKLKNAISAKLQLTIEGIRNASKDIADLANRLQGRNGTGIPIITEQIFTLERDVTNAAGNLHLVADDVYKVETIANANKLNPQDNAGTKIPDNVEKAIVAGPEIMLKAREEIFKLFNGYAGKMESLITFMVAKQREQCGLPGKFCPQKCAVMEKYVQGSSPLSVALRPIDPSKPLPVPLINPKEYLVGFRSDLEACLVDFSKVTGQGTDLSSSEQYQLKFSTEMNRFYPAILR